MIFAVSILGALLVFAAYSIAGGLGRIANALEAQNRFYGIGVPPAVDAEGVEPIGTERTS